MINGITHENQGFNIINLESDKLSKINEVYICPSFLCNLNCPHCTLKNLPSKMNVDSICNTLSYLNKNSGNNLIYDLFGGEPLLLNVEIINRIYNIIKERKYLVSTNLLHYNESKHSSLFKDAEWINVSWNPKRFTNDQYKLWIKILDSLKLFKLNAMVTLTNDLITDFTPQEFIKLLKQWDVYSIDFDYFIGKDDENDELIDNWLCELYDIWDIKTKYNIADGIKNALLTNTRYKDCSNHYTIMPSGNIKYGCAYWETDVIKTKCLMCELYSFCNGGCRLETKCTFPKKLYYKIRDEI